MSFGQYEYVDVTFNATANVDTVIPHNLILSDVDVVRWIPVSWGFTSAPATVPIVYQDTSSSKRAWGANHVILRCNVASATVRLLLFVEAA